MKQGKTSRTRQQGDHLDETFETLIRLRQLEDIMGNGAVSKTSRMKDMPSQSKGKERLRPSIKALILYIPSILQTYARMGHEDKDW
jgi:hypothetical protein